MALTKVDTSMVESSGAFGRRNILINGDYSIAQRGTSSTGIGANASTYYTADRWKMDIGGSNSGRVTMTAVVDDAPTESNVRTSLKLECTTADTSIGAGEYFILGQQIEGFNLQQFKKGTSGAKEFTVSFFVKGNGSATYVVELYDSDNGRQISKTFAVTSSWSKVELTFPADTTGAFDNDANASLNVSIWLHAGSEYTGGTLNSSAWAAQTPANRAAGISSFMSSTSNTFAITAVQLEVGDVATEFEQRPYNQELIECRRYFERKQAKQNTFLFIGQAFNTTGAFGTFDYQVEKRNTPSISFSGEGNSSTDWQWLTAAGSSPSGTGTTSGHTMTTWNARLQAASYTGLTNQAPSGFYSFGTAYVDIDAEV